MITMTESAQRAVRSFIDQDQSLAGKVLRVFVQGGGCSGFEYGFTFGDRQENDEILSCEGFDVAIDPMSLPYLNGSLVDFRDGLQGSGFVVQNPNANGSCGCGKSFSA